MKPAVLFVFCALSACTIETELFQIETPEDIREVCEEGSTEVFEYLAYFGRQDPGCPWDEGDNQSPAEGQVTARIEDTVAVPLPADAVLCGLELDFDPTGTGQVMTYDDDFFLTMSEVILLASDATQVEVMPLDDTLPTFDWSSLVGFEIDFGEVPPFCLGGAESLSTCEIPPDETPGSIQFAMEQSLVDELSFRTFTLQTMDFSFITLGDNDAAKDCAHASYQFMVRMPYTPAPPTQLED